jgi:hypothetical protein
VSAAALTDRVEAWRDAVSYPQLEEPDAAAAIIERVATGV